MMDIPNNQLAPREWASIERISLKNITDKTPVDQEELTELIVGNLADTLNCFTLGQGLISTWWKDKPEDAKTEALQAHRDLIERLEITIEAADSLENEKNKKALKDVLGHYLEITKTQAWDNQKKVISALNEFRQMKGMVKQVLQS